MVTHAVVIFKDLSIESDVFSDVLDLVEKYLTSTHFLFQGIFYPKISGTLIDSALLLQSFQTFSWISSK